MDKNTSLIKFSINNWDHLYSLKTAILRKHEFKGGRLAISGIIRNQAFNNSQDTPINIQFHNVVDTPDYPKNQDEQLVLGILHVQAEDLFTSITVDDEVFNELRKNLMEYGELDGIHIVVSLELEGSIQDKQQHINILDLSYAMKGDA